MKLEDFEKPIQFEQMKFGITYVTPDGKEFTNELEHRLYMEQYNWEKEWKFQESIRKSRRKTDVVFFGWMILLFVILVIVGALC